ncbi:MAG: hypothetical protein WA691_05790 [Thermoplasmata archaeon]
MTVVGGSAVEIYTQGDYVSSDLDLVVTSRDRITTVLEKWGFHDDGKLWSRPAWGIYVDPMQTQLSGSQSRTLVVRTSVGSFRISGVEDLIIRRVRESVAWPDRQEAFSQAVLLAEHSGSDVDWDYIEFYAEQEGWERPLAELRRFAGKLAPERVGRPGQEGRDKNQWRRN